MPSQTILRYRYLDSNGRGLLSSLMSTSIFWLYGSYFRTLAQLSSFMERMFYETYRPRFMAFKLSKFLGSIIISLTRLKLLAPASVEILETLSTSRCLMTMINLSLPDVCVVVIPANCLLACDNLKSCLRDFMETSSVYLYFSYVASLGDFISNVVSSKVVELLSFVFHWV